MAKLTPLQKRAARKARDHDMVDMNLVSLIDVFTILIFFLLSNATEVEILPASKAVRLPESVAETAPQATLVVTVSAEDIVVEGRRVAATPEALAQTEDLIAPLQAELQRLLAERQAVRAENDRKSVTLMADQELPYQLLRKVMVSCARAGLEDVRFAVRQKAVSS
ncbi:biopolymer transporter ExbD [Ideonella sp. 4Y16]|uniref:Biopolymer transporter ExbD n=1 Tax=Ideonella alba TaxID=2824118 RepID=A0A941BEZ0_9BURK|nr:biopolymer transporter ExbD [Ideonella alba]MBQ0931576.1 biopolymer transporter ExbD [Ideonella alba]MBQ0943882.1 biopolymer transporter ExbD [Ideonella alba]